jgi:hypothetical protein
MPVTHDRASDLERARALLARLSSNSTEPEALSSFRQYRKLLGRHGFSLGELLTGPDSRPMGLEDWLRIGDKAKEVIATGKAALADPDLRTTASAAAELFRGVSAVVKKVRAR